MIESNHNSTQPQYGFMALAMRQRLIKRWSTMRCSETENVLEHSAVVTMLAYLVGHIAMQQGKNIDLATMLAHASMHDVAEVLCSDLIQPIKEASKVMHTEFKKLEKEAESKLIRTLPEELQQAVEHAFAPGGYEQQLVKCCDIYSAYIKCRLETAYGNGMEFQDALSKMEITIAQIKRDFPEMALLDNWFGDGFSFSVDRLLANGE